MNCQKFKTILLLILPAMLLLVACNKETPPAFTDSPIIESYITPGNKLALHVSRQIPFATAAQVSADNLNTLNITVSYNNSPHVLTALGSGQYIDNSHVAVAGDQYALTFTYNSKQVSTTTVVPSKPLNFHLSDTVIRVARQVNGTNGPATGFVGPPVNLTWTNTDGSYYFVLVQNMETVLDPIAASTTVQAVRDFKKTPTTGNADILRGQDFQFYGKHKVTLYHVLPDYASLYAQSNSSSLNLTNPSSNITNGYGIFTGMNSTVLYIYIRTP